MKILFCVFSGTGNTRRAAEKLMAELSELGHASDLFMIKKDAPMPEVGAYDLLILGYPVHAFNAPVGALDFMRALPKTEGMPVYLMRTSGEPSKLNHASGITPKRILKKRGYRVMGELCYVMPYNIMFRHSEEMASRMWHTAQLRIKADARTVSDKTGELKRVNAWRRAVAFTLRIEHTAMPFIGRGFRVTDKCIGCGKCIRVCPQNNIAFKDGKPVFGKHCTGCMGCAFCCPEDAVKISVLNGWRVNGDYAFDTAPATDQEICRYCRKMYTNYFHESEKL